MPLIPLVAASFACVTPAHATGAMIRCEGRGAAMTLAGISVLPPSAPCRRYSDCPVDPGTAARDHLAELTRGRQVTCSSVAGRREAGGKRLVRCTVAGRGDLACAMLADGAASPSGPLDCAGQPAAPARPMTAHAADLAALPLLWRWGPVYLIVMNIITYLLFAVDRQRLRAGLNRVAPVHLLTLVGFGGGIGALVAQQRLDHLRDDQSFTLKLLAILGVQIGVIFGLVGLYLF